MYAEDIDIRKERFILNFTEITELVRRHYCHVSAKGLDMHHLFKEYYGKIKTCTHSKDFIECLLEYFACLKNSHTGICLQKYKLNVCAKVIEDKIYIHEIGRGVDFDLKQKDEILQVDHIPVWDWIHRQEKKISASTSSDLILKSLRAIFYSYYKCKRYITIQREGMMKEIRLELNQERGEFEKSEMDEMICYRRINDKIDYISLKSITNEIFVEFENILYRLKNSQHLILDLRENEGGNSVIGEKILSFFIHRNHTACVSGKIIEPAERRYRGKLILLTDEMTFSAAESLVLDLQESASALVVGKPTAGDTGNNPQIFTTTDGISFSIPTRRQKLFSVLGFPLEGEGIQPDYRVHIYLADYKRGVDSILEQAIDIIENKG